MRGRDHGARRIGGDGNREDGERMGARTNVQFVETTDLWRKISFYVCIPGIIVGGLWTYKVESAHAEHL